MGHPVCLQCGKKLRPVTRSIDRRSETVNALGQPEFSIKTEYVVVPGQFGHDNCFCTRRCGYAYGLACARHA
jgi:hypothetical protein